jgi:hypothetical protein
LDRHWPRLVLSEVESRAYFHTRCSGNRETFLSTEVLIEGECIHTVQGTSTRQSVHSVAQKQISVAPSVPSSAIDSAKDSPPAKSLCFQSHGNPHFSRKISQFYQAKEGWNYADSPRFLQRCISCMSPIFLEHLRAHDPPSTCVPFRDIAGHRVDWEADT